MYLGVNFVRAFARRGSLRILLVLCSLVAVGVVAPAGASAAFGVSAFSVTPSTLQQGGHPNLAVSFTRSGSETDDVRDIALNFPPGLKLDPTGTNTCSNSQLSSDSCPSTSRVGTLSGTLTVQLSSLSFTNVSFSGSAYLLAGGTNTSYTIGIVVRPSPWRNIVLKQVITPNSPVSGGIKAALTNIQRTVDLNSFVTQNITIKGATLTFTARSGTSGSGPFFVTNPTTCGAATTTGVFTAYDNSTVTKASSFTPTGCPTDTTPPTFSPVCTPGASSVSCTFTPSETLSSGPTCTLAGPTPSPAAACTSPKAYTGLAAGAYTFSVSGKDLAGNTGTNTVTFTPVIPPLTFTTACTTSSNTGTCTFTPSSPLNAAGATCSLAGPTPSPAAACASPKSYTVLMNGSYTFTVSGTSAAGSAGTGTATFAINTPVPTIVPSCTAVPGSATCTWTSSEAITGTTCALSGPVSGAASACSQPKTYSGLPSGSYAFSVTGTDSDGNVGTGTATFTVPSVPPISNVGCTTSGSSATCTWVPGPLTAAGAICTLSGPTPSPAAPCVSPKNYTALSNGNYTFTVTATNTDGISGTGTTSFVINTPAPTFSPTCVANGTNANCSWTTSETVVNQTCGLSGPIPSPTGPCSGTVKSYSGLADGTYTFTVSGVDADGNPGSGVTTFTVDATPPSFGPSCAVSQATATCAFAVSEPLTAGPTCALTGPQSYPASPCSSPKSYGNLPVGNYVFTVSGTDMAGNHGSSSASFTVTFHGDPTPPSCSYDVNGTVTCMWAIDPSWTAVQCQFDGVSTPPCTSPKVFPYVHNGTHVFTLTVSDAVGNIVSLPNAFDVNAPLPSFTGGCTASSGSASASCSFFANKTLTSTTCALSGPVSSPASPCTSPKSYTGLTPGNYAFTAAGVDLAGNSGSTTFTFAITDVTPPVITPICTPAGSSVSCSVTFSEQVINTTCQLIGPVNYPQSPCTASTMNYSGLADGTYTFVVRATDLAGNPGSGQTTFTIDTTPPTFSSVGCSVSANSATCSWMPSETIFGQSCQLNGPITVAATGCSGTSITYSNLTPGSYVFTVRGADARGNIGTGTATFTIPPVQAPLAYAGLVCTVNGVSVTCIWTTNRPTTSQTCLLVGASPQQGPESCSSPKSYINLGAGSYTFTVTGVDSDGNTASVAAFFTIGDPAPNTSISGDPLPANSNGTPVYSFTSSGGATSFECRYTAQPSGTPNAYNTCVSGNPFPVMIPSGDDYKIEVRACTGGYCDATPATAFVYVDTSIPAATATIGASTSQAGAHPDLTTTVNLTGGMDPRSATIKLPPGLNGALTGADKCTIASANAGTCASTAPGSQIGTVTSVGLSTRDGMVSGGGQLFMTDPPSSSAPAGVAGTVTWPNGLGQATVIGSVNINQSNNAPSTTTVSPTGAVSVTNGAFVNTSQGEIRQSISIASIPRTTDLGNRIHAISLSASIQGSVAHGSGTYPLLTNPSTCPVVPAQFFGDGNVYADSTANTPGPTVATVRVNYPVTGCPLPFNPTIGYQYFQPTDIRPTTQWQPQDTLAEGTFNYAAPEVSPVSVVANNDTYELDPDTGELIPGTSSQMGIAGIAATLNLPVGNSPVGKLVAYLPQGIGVNFEALGSTADRCSGATVSTVRVFTGVCPTQAKIGTMTITTPLLPNPVVGKVMVASTAPVPSFGVQIDPTLSPNNPQGVTLRLTGLNNTISGAPGCSDGALPEDRAFWCGTRIFSTFSALPDVPLTQVALDLSGSTPRPNPGLNPLTLAVADQGDSGCRIHDILRSVFTPVTTGGSPVTLDTPVDFDTC
ncbi:MAG: hypothetical protein ACRDKI_06960 [Solirubrobacterales bacterium]